MAAARRAVVIEELDAEYLLYRMFKKGPCASEYDGAPGCGQVPCFPSSCLTPR